VVQADVSFEQKLATVQYDPQHVTPEQMIEAINRIGFRASRQEAAAGALYQGRGKVVAIDREKGMVTLDHGEIKGLMPPMVMAFVVDSQEALDGLHPGDSVTFTLNPRGVTFTIAELTVVKP
jgi:Cu/Ag efflux protein CusF